MTARAAVIDYGAGNVHSIHRALGRAGFDTIVAARPGAAKDSDLLVLPGQGRFGQVVEAFERSGFEPLVRDHLDAGRPFFGVCVGLQLLLEGSEEDGGAAGLGLVGGHCRRFTGDVRVPQMGWNQLEIVGAPPLLGGVSNGDHVYFANSYYAELTGEAADAPGAVTTYGDVRFRSAFSVGGLHATQFHPEKSQGVGLTILENLRRIVAAHRVAA